VELINRLLILREHAQAVKSISQNQLFEKIDWNSVSREIEEAKVSEQAKLGHLAAVLGLLENAFPPVRLPPAKKPPQGLIRVKRVIDGDTILLENGEKVRYIGIDCPEPNGWDGQPEPFAIEATERNRQLLEGKRIRLEKDRSDRDRYGRLLRYVYVGDKMVNAELVRDGLANAFIINPDVGQENLFRKLEAEAQKRGRGLWGGPGIFG
jgi:micrococcal nuclease